jgi:polysaccharide pyruvyl transferase WcaK-like protein
MARSLGVMAQNVLVEPGVFHTLNIGDMAMLAAATRRLREAMPDARIRVFTDDPERLRLFCPGVEPIDAEPRRDWFSEGALVPRGAHAVRVRPRLAAGILSARRRLRGRPLEPVGQLLAAIESADLFVLCGMGAINDAFPNAASALLTMLELFQRRRAPTALMGQGLGPLDNPELRNHAAQVLPQARLLALRESRFGEALALSLGVDASRIRLTGDDAVAIVAPRLADSGGPIGLNLRAVPYTGVTGALAAEIAGAVGPAARITISYVPGEREDGGEPPVDFRVVDEIAACSVIVATSYHAAVFALAQGVPAIGLTASRYYDWKFGGLADLFPGGLAIVDLRADDWRQRLTDALNDAARVGVDVRAALVESARRQDAAGRDAYGELARLM